MPLKLNALPALYLSSDETAVRFERRFLVATFTRLGLAVLAATFAAVATLHHHEGANLSGLLAAAAFTGALIAEVWLINEQPEHIWYENRALAESAKSLAWRFAVGGSPYRLGGQGEGSDFETDLAYLLQNVRHLRVSPAEGEGVTADMSDLRAADITERRDAYVAQRVMDQQNWYAKKAALSNARAERWRLFLIAIEVAGVVAALTTGLGYLRLDLSSIISTILGVAVAWLAFRQHDALARGYTFASHELAIIAARLHALDEDVDEETWAAAVDESEDIISREHAAWRAARLVEQPVLGNDRRSR